MRWISWNVAAFAVMVSNIAPGQESLCNPCVDLPTGPRTGNFDTHTPPPVIEVTSAFTSDADNRVCPVSIPNTLLLGQNAPSQLQWYGSDTMAAALPRDGVWRGMGPERNYANKLFWLVAAFEPGLESEFSLTGHLLNSDDSMAAPIVSGVTNAHHQSFGGWTVLTGLGFPSKGCWEVTGSFRGQQLTFVVSVQDSAP